MYTPLVLYSTIFALSMERTRLTFHCWLYNLCIVVYVTNKTWNLKTWNFELLDRVCVALETQRDGMLFYPKLFNTLYSVVMHIL